MAGKRRQEQLAVLCAVGLKKTYPDLQGGGLFFSWTMVRFMMSHEWEELTLRI